MGIARRLSSVSPRTPRLPLPIVCRCRFIGSSGLRLPFPSKSITQGQRYQIALKISRDEKVLRHPTRIFMVAVIAPIRFAGPSFSETVVDAGERLVVGGVERPGRSVRRNDQYRTARPG